MTVPLSELEYGQTGLVHNLITTGRMRQRLLDLGLVPGSVIERMMDSPIGDPACYRICGAMIALRRQDAGQVLVTV